MPLVIIKVTGGSEAPSVEQKAELIRGATELLVRVLGKIRQQRRLSSKRYRPRTGASVA